VSTPGQTGGVLDQQVRFLKGVGPHRAELLARLGIATVRDVLLHLPRDYEDRRHLVRMKDLRVGQKAVVSGEVLSVEFRPVRGKQAGILQVTISDGTGSLQLVWFNARHGWQDRFREHETLTAHGEVGHYRGAMQMIAPTCEAGMRPDESEEFGSIVPVYPSTEGLGQKVLRKITRSALEAAASQVPDLLPEPLRAGKNFPPAAEALRLVHFPKSPQDAERARRRLVYEELLVFQCALALQRRHLRERPGIPFKIGPNVDRRIRRLFPFTFTSAQNRVIEEMSADARAPRPMNRLLQGDVGCGKTVVALYAMLAAIAESSKGYQVALMAPTEVLAEQHYLTLESILRRARVRTLLLSRSTSVERDRNLRRIAAGEVDLVVGTHALIQHDVRFRNLALLIIDEQHRFGVRQRLALRRKGAQPDVLIMTATPIPRTLALACFGDMDVSIIDEMPPGRKPVQTVLLPPERWDEAFDVALRELHQGRRIFVIFPLVRENEELDLTSATRGYEELSRGAFRHFRCCLLHGQMPPEAKRKAMEGFRLGRYQVMVATTVVEVGVDVPEATVMIIQHAERLGLAQLHQLRGRIGRGQAPGMCFLLAEPTTRQALQRLEVLTRTADGFEIAEADLRTRGPGRLFGTQQSGLPELRCYDFSDPRPLEEARRDAFALVERDPALSLPEHGLLREEVRRRYASRLVLGSVG